MWNKDLVTSAAFLTIAIFSSTRAAVGQTNENYATRVLRGDVTPTLASPSTSAPVASSTLQSDRDLRIAIMKDCGVSAWQVSVETDASNQIHYQMSPSLSPAAKKCVTTSVQAAQNAF